MEFVPIDDTISDDLRPGANSLVNPSFLSEYNVSLAYDVLKWCAVLVASVAFFATLISRLGFVIVKRNSPILQPLLGDFVDFDDFSDDDTSSEVSSLSDYNDQSEEESEEPESPSYRRGQDFRGSDSSLRRRRSFAENLSQLYSGRSVVKLWDNIGSKFRSISLADCANVDFPVIRPTSPGIIVSAGLNNVRNIALNAWDARIGFRVPAILAEWSPGLDGGFEVVGDVRNVSRPLADEEMEDWWDADAVTDDSEFGD